MSKCEKKIPFRTAYGSYNPEDYGLSFDGEDTMTHQSFRDECDVNRIVSSFERTGVLPTTSGTPMYGDFDNAYSYKEAFDLVCRAQESFMELPAQLRARFENDPAQFLDFVNDPANMDEAVRLGLAQRPSESVLGGTPSPSEGSPSFSSVETPEAK